MKAHKNIYNRKIERLLKKLRHAEEMKEKSQFLLRKVLAESKETERKLAQREAELKTTCDQVIHDIQSPLSSLNQILKLNVPLNGDSKKILNLISARIKNIILDLKNKNESLQSTENYILEELLDEIVLEKKSEHPSLKVEFTFSTKSKINFPKSELQRVFSNLLNNCVDSSKSGQSNVNITINSYPNQIEILIRDDGKGIPENIKNKIWNKGFTTKTSPYSSGLGLYHAKHILNEFSADIILLSSSPKGTCFQMIIPTHSILPLSSETNPSNVNI